MEIRGGFYNFLLNLQYFEIGLLIAQNNVFVMSRKFKSQESEHEEPEHIDVLRAAIQLKHQCKPNHRESVFVHEMMEGQKTIWKGSVEVFDLSGHRDAKTCYAWRHIENNGEVRILTVLGSYLIDSPQRAVQAAIFMDMQPAPSPAKSRDRVKP